MINDGWYKRAQTADNQHSNVHIFLSNRVYFYYQKYKTKLMTVGKMLKTY